MYQAELFQPVSNEHSVITLPSDISDTEKDTIRQTGQPETDSYWWRKDAQFTKWLRNIGYNPDEMPDWLGEKQWHEFVRAKGIEAERSPAGSATRVIAEGLGSVAKGIGDLVDKIPVVKELKKPMGSVFKFIGNLVDLPANVLRGFVTSLKTGDDFLKNIGSAILHGVTGGQEGKYFSFTDGWIQNRLKHYKQGHTAQQYDDYVNSNEWRSTKRKLQLQRGNRVIPR